MGWDDLSGSAEFTVWSDTLELTGEEMWGEGQVLLVSILTGFAVARMGAVGQKVTGAIDAGDAPVVSRVWILAMGRCAESVGFRVRAEARRAQSLYCAVSRLIRNPVGFWEAAHQMAQCASLIAPYTDVAAKRWETSVVW